MSNLYEAMRRVLEYATSYLDIVPDTAASNEDVAAVCKMLDAWSALAPDWDSAPEWAQWYAIDANGEANWFESDVQVTKNASFWGVLMDRDKDAGFVDLPIGIDWRLCKWSREGAK